MKAFNALLAALLIALAPAASAKTIEMDVNGLVCAFCAQGIEKTLRGFAQTDDVYVSLENRLVAIAVKDGTDVADETLRRALTDAGYTVVAIRRSEATLDSIRERAAANDDRP